MRAFLVAILLIGSASAHVPSFADAGGSPDTAFHVTDPDQSRVFYGELEAGAQHWFRFDRQLGDAIDVSVHLPPGEVERPALWIVGPGLPGEGPRQTPSGLGGQQASLMDDLSVEPFTPLAMRGIREMSEAAPADGTFFVVVEADAATTYSVAIGLGESFTVIEWVTIPIQRVGIIGWAGIPWPLALTGEALATAGVVALAWRRGLAIQQSLGFVAAGAIAGSGVTTLLLAVVAAVQAGVSASLVVPVVFSSAAFGIGFGAYRAVRRGRAWAGIAWGAAGLAAWAGLIIGPAALVAWSLWRLRSNRAPSSLPPG